MSARKYSSSIYGQQDIQAWRYGGSGNIDSASIDENKILSITLADGQPVIATGRAGHFSASPDVAGRIFYSDGNVGIGPFQNPPTSLYVSSNNTAAISVASYSDTHSPKITIDNARGNSDNPSDSVVGDTSSFVFRNRINQGIWVNSGVIRSQLKNIDGKSNLDFYVNGGSGEEKVLSLNNSGDIGIGTDSPSEMLHIRSASKAALLIEADTGNAQGGEDNTAYIKMKQDGAAVSGYTGFCSGPGKSPEDTAYGQEDDNNTKTLSNALLISNDWASPNAAVQVGTQSSVIATFRNGRVGIGKTNPSSLLDVNGEIAADSVNADSVIAGSVDVNGRLTFKELIFGAAQSYGGIAKYPIRELNDVLWRADVRSGNSLADTGSNIMEGGGVRGPVMYPKNDHGETPDGNLRSILDKGDDQVVPIITDAADLDGPGPSGDIFIAETSWVDESSHSLTVNSALPKVLFDGLWSNLQKLRPDFSHEFVINFMKHKNFNENGLSYGEGKFYIGFFGTAKNFAKIKLEAFYLQRSTADGIYNNTGRWVECCDPITSPDDERNISISPNTCYFEMSVSNASSETRPIINQRTREVMDATGAKRSDYYLSALRVTVEAGSLPLGPDDGPLINFGSAGMQPQWLAEDNNTDWLTTNMKRTSANYQFGCWVADMAFLPTRRQFGLETSFFHKFEDMSTIPGGIYFGDGAAANPTVTFTSGDNYGIFYDPTSSQMGLSGGGNEAITIDVSGDITKLGQDVPAENEVLTWENNKVVWSPNAASAGITEVLDDLTPQLGGNLDVNSNSITSSGDLDISINSSGPGAVHVAGSEPTISIQRGSNANPSSIDFMGAAGFVGAYVRHIENQDGSGGTNNDLAIGTGGTVEERLRITGDGRVGIGITNPDKQLHVTSDIKVDGTTTLNGIEYAWPATDGQSGQALITDSVGGLSWVDADSVAGIESQQVMVDFNINTKPVSTNVGRVYARNAGVGNIDGGTISQEIIVSDQGGPSASNSGFDRTISTTFETTIDEARNHFMCGFAAHDSSLVRVQTVTMPVHSWADGLYASIWRGTYTNLSNGNVVWNRVSLINVVNDEDNSLTAGTISFDEDIINSNNSFSKGDLWALIFWSDAVAVGASTSNTWITGNLFFEKD